jgi:hypothetical protein
MGQLFRGVHPDRRHALRDRVIAIEHMNREIVSWTMPGIETGTLGYYDDGSAIANGQTRTKITIAPTKPDHFVIGFPLTKCVICRMQKYNSAAVAHIRFKRRLHSFRPSDIVGLVTSVEVYDYHLMAGKMGPPSIPVVVRSTTGRAGGHINGKALGRREEAPDRRGGGDPIVIVDPVYNQHADLRLIGAVNRHHQN